MNTAIAEQYNDRTVDDHLKESVPDWRELISELAVDNEYWAKVEVFTDENEYSALEELTPKQQSWLERIKDGLEVQDKKRR